jgi:hypothetical protein
MYIYTYVYMHLFYLIFSPRMSPYVSMKNSPSNSTVGTASGSTEPSPLNSALNSPRGAGSSTDKEEHEQIFHNSKTELNTIGELDDRQYDVDVSQDIVEEINDLRSSSIKPFTSNRYVFIISFALSCYFVLVIHLLAVLILFCTYAVLGGSYGDRSYDSLLCCNFC